MATNDFIVDLVEKFNEENIEFVVVSLQKSKGPNSSANAFYNITSNEGAEMIAVTLDEVFNELADDYDAFNPDVNDVWPEEDNDDQSE